MNKTWVLIAQGGVELPQITANLQPWALEAAVIAEAATLAEQLFKAGYFQFWVFEQTGTDYRNVGSFTVKQANPVATFKAAQVAS